MVRRLARDQCLPGVGSGRLRGERRVIMMMMTSLLHSSSGVGTNNLRSDQDRMMQEQEEGLDLLGDIIRCSVKI